MSDDPLTDPKFVGKLKKAEAWHYCMFAAWDCASFVTLKAEADFGLNSKYTLHGRRSENVNLLLSFVQLQYNEIALDMVRDPHMVLLCLDF